MRRLACDSAEFSVTELLAGAPWGSNANRILAPRYSEYRTHKRRGSIASLSSPSAFGSKEARYQSGEVRARAGGRRRFGGGTRQHRGAARDIWPIQARSASPRTLIARSGARSISPLRISASSRSRTSASRSGSTPCAHRHRPRPGSRATLRRGDPNSPSASVCRRSYRHRRVDAGRRAEPRSRHPKR